MGKKRVSEWKEVVKPALHSKHIEFSYMGYSIATTDEIWNCLTNHVWQGDPEKKLHQVVQDILHLSSSTYMNYLTLHTYQDDDLMESIRAVMEE